MIQFRMAVERQRKWSTKLAIYYYKMEWHKSIVGRRRHRCHRRHRVDKCSIESNASNLWIQWRVRDAKSGPTSRPNNSQHVYRSHSVNLTLTKVDEMNGATCAISYEWMAFQLWSDSNTHTHTYPHVCVFCVTNNWLWLMWHNKRNMAEN